MAVPLFTTKAAFPCNGRPHWKRMTAPPFAEEEKVNLNSPSVRSYRGLYPVRAAVAVAAACTVSCAAVSALLLIAPFFPSPHPLVATNDSAKAAARFEAGGLGALDVGGGWRRMEDARRMAGGGDKNATVGNLHAHPLLGYGAHYLTLHVGAPSQNVGNPYLGQRVRLVISTSDENSAFACSGCGSGCTASFPRMFYPEASGTYEGSQCGSCGTHQHVCGKEDRCVLNGVMADGETYVAYEVRIVECCEYKKKQPRTHETLLKDAI